MILNIHIQTATIHASAGAGVTVTGSPTEVSEIDTAALFSFAGEPPAIGQPWPEQGGVLAGIMPAEGDQPAYYLIVPTDAAAFAKSMKWGEYGTEVKGLSARDGLANTKLLCASGGDHPAAKFCAGLKIGDFNDFYLPSRREASLMAATVPHLFEEGWHWTSTQSSAYFAFIQHFSGGYQDRYDKSLERRVRAVRRLIH